MFEQGNPARPVGVLVRKDESTEQLPTRTLVHCSPAQMYGIQYGDDSGKAHTAVVVKIGNAWYLPPNAEEWAGKLKPIASWLGKQLEEQITQKDNSVPKTDSVDILSGDAE